MSFANKENKTKGGKCKNFKTPIKWEIKNKILYGILYSIGMPPSEFANEIGVNIRTVERWVFEGKMPNGENMKVITEYLGYPREILFYDTLKE